VASALRDIFRHNAWANQRVIAFLTELPPDQLEVSADAVYGNLRATMHHVFDGEVGYWSFFSKEVPSWFQPESEPVPLRKMADWAFEMGKLWEKTNIEELDADAWVERERSEGRFIRLKTGILLAQTIHHGNVHREQVSHVLTTLGLTAPDLSLYAYAREARA
jgi:uncharacterized damage-inducible protein DinB